MDIISFNEASTANGRIENFIENPDSTSGVLTVPKTIAAGETITIPAGRVAILPDLQVDGDLVVDGDLFIPTGSMTSQVVQKVTSTDNAVVRFDGTSGQVQNSGVTIDDNNDVMVVNQTDAGLVKLNTGMANPIADTRLAQIVIGNTTSTASARIAGYTDGNWSDGVSSPTSLRFYTTPAGSNAVTERMRIDSAGNVAVGVIPTVIPTGYKTIQLGADGSGIYGYNNSFGMLLATNAKLDGSVWKYSYGGGYKSCMFDIGNDQAGTFKWYTAPSGTAGNAIAWTNAMTLGANGNLLIGTSTDNGLDKLQVVGSINAEYGLNSFKGRLPYIGSNPSWSVMAKDPNYTNFTDLNNLIKTGRYNCNGGEVSNTPNVNEWWYVDVMSHSNTTDGNYWIQQIIYPMGASGAYTVGVYFIRQKRNGVWSSWVQK